MTKTRTVPAGRFKATCLKLMDEIAAGDEEIVITKRGKPIAKLVPMPHEPEQIFGYMKGTIDIIGDIIEPAESDWEADRD